MTPSEMNPFRLARYEAGLSIAQASTASGVSARTIQRAESDDFDAPSAGVVKALSDAYGTPVATLLGIDKAAA